MSAVRSMGKETIGAIVVLSIVAVSALVLSGVLQDKLSGGGERVRAQFRDTGRLSKGDPVRVQGVRVGQVTQIALERGGRAANVELEVSEDAMPLYADAQAVIRWRTVLGGAFAVDVDRGSPSAGELGDRVIPASRTANQVELDEILTTFREPQLDGLKTLLDEFPRALADPREPARVLEGLAAVSPKATRAVRALRGRDEGDVRDLVTHTARTVAALDRPTNPLRDVVEGAAATLQVTGRREADLRETLERGARVLPQARTTLARLDITLRAADPLLDELRKPAADVKPTLDELRPVLERADRLLVRARPALLALRPAVTSLARAARIGSPLLAAIQPSLDKLDGRILPALAKPDSVSGRPAYQMVGPTFAGLDSAAARFDSGGHLIKLSAQFGERPLQTPPCTTYLTDPTPKQLLSCELLRQALQDIGGPP